VKQKCKPAVVSRMYVKEFPEDGRAKEREYQKQYN
jgi:hypothetical protein